MTDPSTQTELQATDIDAIERATLAAVSPDEVEEFQGWLLAFDSGTISRAKCAVPLCNAACDAATLHSIEARYRAHGLAPLLRVSDQPLFAPLRALLLAAGYRPERHTQVQVAATTSMRVAASHARNLTAVETDIADAPDAAWCALFLGSDFDPVDGASRIAHLSRASANVYASLRAGGETLAGGAGSFSHGWASVHGMRTAQAQRGQGLAGQVLAALAQTARQRGYARCFLQVEAHNAAALALYRRCGFRCAWSYAYWRRD